MVLKKFKISRGVRNLMNILIIFSFFSFVCLPLISETYPVELHEYLPNFNLIAKQVLMPEELADIRSGNKYAISQLNTVSSELKSIQAQRDILQDEVDTLNKLLVSEAYNVKPSKVQLLEQAIAEEKLLAEHEGKQPNFKQLCLSGLIAFIILKSIILLNIGWD